MVFQKKVKSLVLSVLCVLLCSLSLGCSNPGNGQEPTTDGGSQGDGGGTDEKKPSFPVLKADGYVTVSNVSIHNKVPADINEVNLLLAKSPVDFAKVKDMYVKGKHSVKSDGSIRTLNGFASKADNFIKYSPEAVKYFKDNGKFLDNFIETGAIDGTGDFKGASDAVRGAAISKGLLVLMSYWVRLEFGKAQGKAKDGNLEPLKGAPHNWDEAFAFYWGPEGKYSLYAYADELSAKYALGESINKAFFEKSLVPGLKKMMEDKASPDDATNEGVKQLHRLFLLGLYDAAVQIDLAKDDEAKAAAQAGGLALWHGVADVIAKASAAADKTFIDVFTGKPKADSAKTIKEALQKVIGPAGMKPEDFGIVLKSLFADGYVTVSNVSIHNKVPADINEVNLLLAKSPVDFAKVKDMYVKGKHSVKSNGSIRTLNGFASKADNFIKYSPEAVKYFKGNGKFLDNLVETGAIDGTGDFKGASDAVRGAVVSKGLLVLMSYWVRLEFGKAMAKAKDGNLDPHKGSPHNWDEAFAFYWGPEGKYSLYAYAAELSTKYKLQESINKAFFGALLVGLKKQVNEKASPDASSAVGTKQLHRLFLLGLYDAAVQIDAGADEAAKATAQAGGLALWHGVADVIAKASADADKAFIDVFTGKPKADSTKTIKEALQKVIGPAGMKAEDFGDALK